MSLEEQIELEIAFTQDSWSKGEHSSTSFADYVFTRLPVLEFWILSAGTALSSKSVLVMDPGPGVALSLLSFLTRWEETEWLDPVRSTTSLGRLDADAALSMTRAGVCRGLKPPAVILANAAWEACGLGVGMKADGADVARRDGRGVVDAPRIGIVAVRSPFSVSRLSLERLCRRWTF